MTDVTQILSQIEDGDPRAAEQLLPLVYDELRQLAARGLSHERANHTLQATALVHEAYLRLVGGDEPQKWSHRGHFYFAAASERFLLRSMAFHAVSPQLPNDFFFVAWRSTPCRRSFRAIIRTEKQTHGLEAHAT